MDYLIILGKKIRDRRKALGISQQELAEYVGYSQKGMISRVESGKVNLPMDKLIAIAEYLKIPATELINADKEPVIDMGIPLGTLRGSLPANSFIIEGLTEEEKTKVLEYAALLRRSREWQQQNGTEKDGGSGSVSTGKSDLSRVQFLDAEDAKKWRDVQGTAEDYLTWLSLTSHGTDTSRK